MITSEEREASGQKSLQPMNKYTSEGSDSMSRFEEKFCTIGEAIFLNEELTEWQNCTKKLLNAKRITEEAKVGKRRPIQIVISTDRMCPLNQIVESIILSTKYTGLLDAKCQGHPVMRFHLILREENAAPMLQKYDEHVNKLIQSGVHFTTEISSNANDSSKLSEARESVIQFIRGLPEDDDPIILWLDDDLAFDSLIAHGNQIKLCRPWSFFHEVWAYHELNPEVDIGLGDVTGAPPLPSSSTLYTNLVDLEANFKDKPTNSKVTRWSEKDYYYDLSELERESSPWPMLDINFEDIEILWNLLETGIIARPLVATPSSLSIQNNRYVRGGNTIIFNSMWINDIDHPNIPRRGDSIWTLLVRKNGGKLRHFSIPLRHIRDNRFDDWKPIQSLKAWKHRLEVDLVGASFQKWFAGDKSQISPQDILLKRCNLQLECFNNSMSVVEKLPIELRTTLREFLKEGIQCVSKLMKNPDVFYSYYKCVGIKAKLNHGNNHSAGGFTHA